MAATDSKKSFDNIDKWCNLIRRKFAREPIQLVLIKKSKDGDDHVVTREMMEKKNRASSQFTDEIVVLDLQEMQAEEVKQVVDDAVEKLYKLARVNDIDARGLLVPGLVYCKGSIY